MIFSLPTLYYFASPWFTYFSSLSFQVLWLYSYLGYHRLVRSCNNWYPDSASGLSLGLYFLPCLLVLLYHSSVLLDELRTFYAASLVIYILPYFHYFYISLFSGNTSLHIHWILIDLTCLPNFLLCDQYPTSNALLHLPFRGCTSPVPRVSLCHTWHPSLDISDIHILLLSICFSGVFLSDLSPFCYFSLLLWI